MSNTNVYIRFERGRDEVMGPTLGPFEWVQQTYENLAASDGATTHEIACWNEKSNEWFIVDGEHEGEFYSDFVIFSSDEPVSEEEKKLHDCAAGKVTTNNDGVTEEKWDDKKHEWVPTGRVWDSSGMGKWKILKKFTVVGISDGNSRFADHVEAEDALQAEKIVINESEHSRFRPVVAGVFEGFLDAKDEQ